MSVLKNDQKFRVVFFCLTAVCLFISSCKKDVPVTTPQTEPVQETSQVVVEKAQEPVDEFAGLDEQQLHAKADEMFAQAKKIIEDADAKLPDSWQRFDEKEYEKVDTSDYRRAADLLEKVVELKDDHAQAYATLGMAYSSLGFEEETIGMYEKAVGVSPEPEVGAA